MSWLKPMDPFGWVFCSRSPLIKGSMWSMPSTYNNESAVLILWHVSSWSKRLEKLKGSLAVDSSIHVHDRWYITEVAVHLCGPPLHSSSLCMNIEYLNLHIITVRAMHALHCRQVKPFSRFLYNNQNICVSEMLCSQIWWSLGGFKAIRRLLKERRKQKVSCQRWLLVCALPSIHQ